MVSAGVARIAVLRRAAVAGMTRPKRAVARTRAPNGKTA